MKELLKEAQLAKTHFARECNQSSETGMTRKSSIYQSAKRQQPLSSVSENA